MQEHEPALDLARHVRGTLWQALDSVGPRFELAFSGLVGACLAGTYQDYELSLVAGDGGVVFDGELAIVVVSEQRVPPVHLRTFESGLSMHLGAVPLRITQFAARWAATQVVQDRDGLLALAERRAIAGSDRVLAGIGEVPTWAFPKAATNLLVQGAAGLLAALEPEPRGTVIEFAALARSGRDLGDAILLGSGHLPARRAERAQRIARADRVEDDARLSELLAWSYGPLSQRCPMGFTEAADRLRRGWISLLRELLTPDADPGAAGPVLEAARRCRRTWWSRLRRLFEGAPRAGLLEFRELALALLFLPDLRAEDRKPLVGRCVRLLSWLGGPVLQNPDWRRLRRETLRLQVPGVPLPVGQAWQLGRSRAG